MEESFTHIDANGHAHMVDVGDKEETHRSATAEGRVMMKPETLAMIVEGRHKKGDVLATCRIAGIMAAKKCSELIPLCHALNLSSVTVDLVPEYDVNDSSCVAMRITSRCKLDAKTGVEMEALTAVSVAALTLYDMCKAVDKAMVIEGVRLLEKVGGRSGHYQAS